jgi:hypothetical protein
MEKAPQPAKQIQAKAAAGRLAAGIAGRGAGLAAGLAAAQVTEAAQNRKTGAGGRARGGAGIAGRGAGLAAISGPVATQPP